MNIPELTVIVPSVNTWTDLQGCLEALEREGLTTRLEILVPERLGDPVRTQLRTQFPAVRVMEVAPATTIPEMRAMGFDAATAPAVAVIEDHVVVPAGWARQMLDALGDGQRFVGGSIENAATGNVLDWAAFLCEYSHCLPPLPAGPAEWLTGNNTVYPKVLLDRYRAVTHEGRWENYLHDAARRDNVPLVCHPEIVAHHKKHYTFGEYFTQRYLYSRSYAGARVAGAPASRRAAFALAALALPPLLFYRTVSRIAQKGRHRDWFIKSIPLIAVFMLAWAWGEAVGSWKGPGNSLSRVC